MSTWSSLRRVFRHVHQHRVSEDALPLGMKQTGTEFAVAATNHKRDTAVPENRQRATSSHLALLPKAPEPLGLEDIAEEDVADRPSSIETASLTETLASLDLEISTFSARELIHATLDEAKATVSSHLDTIDTTLALLNALDGFSETISELRKEMLDKKQACEEKMVMLDAVERAIEGMAFAGESQEQDVDDDAAER